MNFAVQIDPYSKGIKAVKNISVEIQSLQKSHVDILLYSVKFNSEIDIVQFIFTRCVAGT